MTHELPNIIEPQPSAEPSLPENSHAEMPSERERTKSGGSSRAFRSRIGWIAAVCGFIVLAVGLVFGQTVGHEFVNFDDDEYVYNNAQVKDGFTVPGIVAAFADHPYYHWQPLAILSHMLDCQLYGLKPGGHHLTSVLLHAAAAIGLFLVLLRMTDDLWPSALVAAVFAVHPLRAESVAWVSERKDVLCALFFMLTVAAYVGYARCRSWPRYLLVMALFGLGLMAKAMLVTLPAVLLLLDYWPLGRLEARGLRLEEAGRMSFGLRPHASSLASQAFGLLLEKIPLALMAAGVCVVTFLSQRSAMLADDRFPAWVRIGNALVSYVAYLGKLFYPVGLAVHYPHPGSNLPLWKVACAVSLLAAITAGVVVWRKRCPYLLVGWLWYLVMLLPVCQVIQLGEYSMADRYTYLPQIGLCIALTWGAAEIGRYWPRRRLVLGRLALLVVGGLMACAWRQVSYWRDSQSLWTQALDVAPRNPLAHNNLADILHRQGQTDLAVFHYQQALEIMPGFAACHYNLANTLPAKGNIEEKIAHYQRALEIAPEFFTAHNNLAALLAAKGEINEAIEHFQKSLAIAPNYWEARKNLAIALAGQGRLDEAVPHCTKLLEIDPNNLEIRVILADASSRQGKMDQTIIHYRKCLEIRPDDARFHNNLAYALNAQGDVDEAVAHYQKALELQPNYATAHVNLGTALYGQGKVHEGVAHWRLAAHLQPNDTPLLYRLAWLLATSPDESIRNGSKAVELADRALQLSGGREPAMFDALGAAYAETGQFEQAVQVANQGVVLANSQHNNVLAIAIRQRMQGYRAGIPFREADANK